jgi:hypothetical protein
VRQTVAVELSRTALEHDPVAAYQQVSRILKPGVATTPANPSTPKANA